MSVIVWFDLTSLLLPQSDEVGFNDARVRAADEGAAIHIR
jgi:hypothetical protein